jgi:hypothetical protein
VSGNANIGAHFATKREGGVVALHQPHRDEATDEHRGDKEISEATKPLVVKGSLQNELVESMPHDKRLVHGHATIQTATRRRPGVRQSATRREIAHIIQFTHWTSISL